MSIPLATTTISILRPDPGADEYENDAGPTTIATGIRAHIGSPGGRGATAEGGSQWAAIDKKMQCDLADLRQTDVVRDELHDDYYAVIWVDKRVALGIDHISAGLRIAEGAHG